MCFVGKCVGGETEITHGLCEWKGERREIVKSIVFSLLSKGEKQKSEEIGRNIEEKEEILFR